MIEVKKVESRKDLKKFVNFPFQLYKDCPYWVPSLDMDEYNSLRKDKNPAFDHCKAEYWLAYKEGKLVGRIAGIINEVANKKWGNKVRFGWFDTIDDPDVANALLKTVELWGKNLGMKEIQGPLGFNDMDKEGLLVEGFDRTPTIATIYNHAYYVPLIEQAGYSKAEDWVQYKIKVPERIPEKIQRVNEIISQRYNLRTVIFEKRSEIKKYAKSLFQTLNAAFDDLYGYAELSDKEIEAIINVYFSFVDPRFICMVLDQDDNVVGFGVSMPTLSEAYKKAKGGLLPFGFIHLLKALKKTDVIDLYLNGVHPDWQKRGIHSLYYTKLNQSYIDNGVQYCITNPQLESNINAVHIWDNYEKEPFMRRRCYMKKLD